MTLPSYITNRSKHIATSHEEAVLRGYVRQIRALGLDAALCEKEGFSKNSFYISVKAKSDLFWGNLELTLNPQDNSLQISRLTNKGRALLNTIMDLIEPDEQNSSLSNLSFRS